MAGWEGWGRWSGGARAGRGHAGHACVCGEASFASCCSAGRLAASLQHPHHAGAAAAAQARVCAVAGRGGAASHDSSLAARPAACTLPARFGTSGHGHGCGADGAWFSCVQAAFLVMVPQRWSNAPAWQQQRRSGWQDIPTGHLPTRLAPACPVRRRLQRQRPGGALQGGGNDCHTRAGPRHRHRPG